MATIAGLEQQFTTLFAEQFHLEVPSVDTDLLETGLLDSLHFVELLLHMEQDFGLRVDAADLDLDQFRSIAAIAAYVAGRLAPDPQPAPPLLSRAA